MRRWEGKPIFAAPPRHSGNARSPLALIAAGVSLLALAMFAPLAEAAHLHQYTSSFGPDGTESTSFERPGSIAIDPTSHTVYVADLNAQSIYKFDSAGHPVDFSATPGSNKIAGIPFRGGSGESQIAASPANHDIYAASVNTIKAFSAGGQPDDFTAGPAAGTNELGGFGELLGVATDGNGDIYAADYDGSVDVYAPSGAQLASFGFERSGNLAVDSQGDIYVMHWQGAVEKLHPSSYPVTGATTWSGAGTIDAETSYSIAVEPETDHVFVDHGSKITEHAPAGEAVAEFAEAEEGAVSNSLGVAVDKPSGTVYASDATSGRVKVYQPVVVPDLSVGATSDATPHTIVVHGEVDPAGGGDVSECKVIYGVDTKYELGHVSCDEAVPYSAATPIEAEITGLQTLTNYHYRVVVTGPGGTVRSADHTVYLAPEAPILGSASVGDVTDTEAKVEAHINPDAGPTIYRIQYGTTQAYGSQTLPSESIGSDETEHAVETELTGLEPGKLYHFRVAATNFGGTVFGPDYTFTTLGPPELGEVSVSNLGPSSATLAIQVNPNLSPTSYRVDYGTGANYGSQSAEVALADTENIFHEVTVQLSGLSPATTYHLRAVAINAIGTAATFDQTLTTAAEPPHVEEPTPPPVVKCKKGFVKRKGKCVKQPHHHRKHHEKGHRHG